ncbi:DUF4192 domain-containing protein [Parafrigoribacterium mesophilum]|uniref:DUF4192 domain-containing protein n=1 Tax=Parafrigoribacterium mesophilum TaxID=433646 RepID=UPI0031FD473A
MTTIVKAHNASDFLALVPYLLGFHPRDSVVLVAFCGNRTRGALRFDLPKTDAALACKRIATTMIGMLCKLPEVDALVPVAFTDDRFADPIPHRVFMETLLRRADLAGFRARDALCVASDGWGSYLEADCPPGGHPLDQISGSDIGRRIPAAARGSLGAVTDGAVIPAVDLGTAERVARLLATYRRVTDTAELVPFGRLGAVFDTDGPPPVFTLPRLIELALRLNPTRIEDRDAALLLWLLHKPVGRDALMLQFAFGPAAGFRVLFGEAKFRDGDDSVARESAALMFGEGPRPDPARITTGIGVLMAVTARAPKSARPAALCTLAWLQWALGRGSVAGILAQQALSIQPDYGFARLLSAMLDAGRLPEWAFETCAP